MSSFSQLRAHTNQGIQLPSFHVSTSLPFEITPPAFGKLVPIERFAKITTIPPVAQSKPLASQHVIPGISSSLRLGAYCYHIYGGFATILYILLKSAVTRISQSSSWLMELLSIRQRAQDTLGIHHRRFERRCFPRI